MSPGVVIKQPDSVCSFAVPMICEFFEKLEIADSFRCFIFSGRYP